jgi:2-dehydropantoate 2-reductase
MNIGIIGTGAMGSLFAARLSAEAAVCMIGSWREQLLAINNNGLKLVHLDGKESTHSFPATDDLEQLEQVDFALILVKGWQTERAAKRAREILTADGLALSLQNGIGNLEMIEREVGIDRALLGITSEGANMIAPGIVRHAGYGTTYIAADASSGGQVREFVDLLNKVGFETHIANDVDSLIWGKLAINAGINPLTGLLQVPNGFLAEDPVARKLMFRAAEETADVARALGIELPYESASEKVLQVAQQTSANISSMAQDVARGSPTEIESITGAIVAISQEEKVPTPINTAFLVLMNSLLKNESWQDAIKPLPQDLRGYFIQLAKLDPYDSKPMGRSTRAIL